MNVYKFLNNPVEAGYKMFNLLMIVGIVLQRYYDHVYICLFVNIEIKILRSHIQQSGVVSKTV